MTAQATEAAARRCGFLALKLTTDPICLQPLFHRFGKSRNWPTRTQACYHLNNNDLEVILKGDSIAGLSGFQVVEGLVDL